MYVDELYYKIELLYVCRIRKFIIENLLKLMSITILTGVKFDRQKSELLAKDKQCSSRRY